VTHAKADMTMSVQERIRARWIRGLRFRTEWTLLLYLVKTESIDAEGIA
jgi:hypothetical protein